MKILILRSEQRKSAGPTKNAYVQEFSCTYAEKVIGNLVGEPGFCASCGPDCNACRKPYDRRFGKNIAGIITLPARLPYLLETPWQYVPDNLPAHDALIAINIHEQILIEFIRRCPDLETRGIIVPCEAPDWLSGSARADARALCEKHGIEIAFPKPFCASAPPAGSFLAQFREAFHIGKPRVKLEISNEYITRANVEISAACGATYYIARWLNGKHIEDDLRYEIIAKRMHAYPCTASMKWDDELGETPLHVAGEAHYEILAQLNKKPAPQEPSLIKSPLGVMVQKPVPIHENLANVEKAKAAILQDLAAGKEVTLQSLRKKSGLPPAAINTALLRLKQQGKIRLSASRILPV